jgi:hypothetical protein
MSYLAAGLVFINNLIKSFASDDTSSHSVGGSLRRTFPDTSASNSGNRATSITYSTAPSDQQSAGRPYVPPSPRDVYSTSGAKIKYEK